METDGAIFKQVHISGNFQIFETILEGLKGLRNALADIFTLKKKFLKRGFFFCKLDK